ncbi:MAG: mechanosensitive ion channel domain-containing protein [Candidatus Njordarchaeum guaymaensis]
MISLLPELQPWVWDALKIIGIILIGIIIDRIIVHKAKTIAKRLHVSLEVIKGTITIFRFILLAAILIMLATVEFLPTEYFVGTGALIGTAIGFGASRYISNYVSGAYILVSGLFRIGDYVKIGSDEGIVVDMSINYTKIRTESGTVLVLSNKNILDKAIVNFRIDGDERNFYVYPIRITLDLKTGWKKIKEIMDDLVNGLKNQALEINYKISEVTKSEATFIITFKVDDAERIPEVKSLLLTRLLERSPA